MDQQLSQDEVNKPVGQQNVAKRKKNEQENTIASRGMKPTGVGK
jgi:hypothetical protein